MRHSQLLSRIGSFLDHVFQMVVAWVWFDLENKTMRKSSHQRFLRWEKWRRQKEICRHRRSQKKTTTANPICTNTTCQPTALYIYCTHTHSRSKINVLHTSRCWIQILCLLKISGNLRRHCMPSRSIRLNCRTTKKKAPNFDTAYYFSILSFLPFLSIYQLGVHSTRTVLVSRVHP